MEHDDDNYEPYIPVRARRKELLQRRLGDVLSSERRSGSRSLSRSRSPSPEPPQPPAAKQAKFAAEEASAPARSREALIQTHGRLVRRQELAGEEEDEVERQLREEAEILRAIRNARALKSAAELAKGIRYDEPLRTSWRPPHHVRTRSREASDRIRAKMHITIEGERGRERKRYQSLLHLISRVWYSVSGPMG